MLHYIAFEVWGLEAHSPLLLYYFWQRQRALPIP
nr:MAG TPA: hypothetical protein [Caudoviricetes sp.]